MLDTKQILILNWDIGGGAVTVYYTDDLSDENIEVVFDRYIGPRRTMTVRLENSEGEIKYLTVSQQ